MILMLVCVQQRLVYEEHCWKLGGKEKGETRDFLSFSGVVSLVVAIPVSWLQLFSRQTLPDATFSRVPQAPPLLFVPPAKVSTVFLLLPISGFVTVSVTSLILLLGPERLKHLLSGSSSKKFADLCLCVIQQLICIASHIRLSDRAFQVRKAA